MSPLKNHSSTELKQVFIDCIPGPTHHFGGHAIGNLPSMEFKETPSNPKKAALEWLEKVNIVNQMGAHQCIIPPHPRPLLCDLKIPSMNQCSSGFMWMANAGHFIPSIDADVDWHQFIPANMSHSKHRNKEYPIHQFWIKKLTKNIAIHRHSPIHENDEGAANTIRLWNTLNKPGVHVFVYGGDETGRFPARQKRKSIDQLIEKLNPKHTFILEQKKMAIDHGVFHNDIISFGFSNYLFCHKHAFENQSEQLSKLKNQFKKITNTNLNIIETNEITLKEAAESYVFNSQIIQTKKGTSILCPSRIKHYPNTLKLVKQWLNDGHFNHILMTNIESSLMNGGGPACLRLTLYLTNDEIQKIPPLFTFTTKRYKELKRFFNNHYPETVSHLDIKTNPSHYRSIAKMLNQTFLI